MDSFLKDKTFALLGRLQSGPQQQVIDSIVSVGGSVTKDWKLAHYLVSDSVSTSQKDKVQRFENNGGKLVSSTWLTQALEKGEDEEEDASSRASTANPKTCPSQSTSTAPPRPGSSKRLHDDEEVKDDSIVAIQSAQPQTKKSKRSSAGPSMVVSVVPHSDLQPAELADLVVPLDDLYCGGPDHVVLIDDQVWDATMNQTNIEQNNNKYYIMQITYDMYNDVYFCFARWGRVGQPGQRHLERFMTKEEAKSHFEKKFKEKTKCLWQDKNNQQIRNKTYMYLQKEYSRKALATKAKNSSLAASPSSKLPVSELDTRLQSFVKLVMDVNVMQRQITAMGINIEELPLGKLTKTQIERGYGVLAQISDAIKNKSVIKDLTLLSSAFYTLIPHQTSGKKRPRVIVTEEEVKCKLNHLQSLEDLRVGTDLLAQAEIESEDHGPGRHPVDINYEKLNCEIVPLSDLSSEVTQIQRYIKETHNDIEDRSFTVKIETVFRLSSPHDSRFGPYAGSDNRQLLWHASRLGNFAGIISQGLRIAPAEAPSSGYRLGKGIYFSDSLLKSVQYCWASEWPSTQCLLLCEVALGKQQIRLEDDIQASILESGCDSTLALGRRQNDRSGHIEIEAGLTMPSGPEVWPIAMGAARSFFEHNEFVVYDPARVRPKFLVQTRFERL